MSDTSARAPGTAKKQIFIVEDDEDIRGLLTELLEEGGNSVASAENGQVALDHLRAADVLPGLILLDLMMPVKDGFQFCVEQAADPRLAQIPVVIMSADGQIREKQLSTHARAYLKKPVDLVTVLDTVKQYCG